MKMPLSRRRFLEGGAALLVPLAGCGDDDAPADGSVDPMDMGGTDLAVRDQGADRDLAIEDAADDADGGNTMAWAGVPEQLVGFGAATTGGRGGRVVMVTSLSDRASDEGSVRWALNQHPGEALYIGFAVEGGIALRDVLEISRPNVTLDARFAPGAGSWFEGARLEIEAGNVFLESIRHFGNEEEISAASDCLRWGVFDRDPDGANDVIRGYARRCEFHHGQDEILAFTPRSNAQATGNRVVDVTVERCIIANATGPDHEFALFIGDGCEQLTLFQNLIFNCAARFPFVRRFAERIELINNAAYNFNENCIQIVDDAEVNVLGALLRLGPRWRDTRAPIQLSGDTRAHVNDARVDSRIDRTNSHGLFRNGEGRPTPSFAGSGLVPMDSGDVAAAIADDCGARLYGGMRDGISQGVIDQFSAGNAPEDLAVGPGPTPRIRDAAFPDHEAFVPRAYLEVFPADTSLESIIDDGSLWDGHMVAERVGAWLTSAA